MRIGNWPLLLLALEHCIRFPDEYDQTSYVNTRTGRVVTRCVAGWIAWFGGYRYNRDTGEYTHETTDDVRTVEGAALHLLDLDPEVYDDLQELDVLAFSLFHGALSFDEVLEAVRDLARADGVTPTPLIVLEMERRGIIAEWETA